MSTGLDWDDIREMINLCATEDGEWAGAPLPVAGIPLVIEPRYPYAGLNGFSFDGPSPDLPDDGEPVKVWNSWHSARKNATVYVCGPEDRRHAIVLPEWGVGRLRYWVTTIGASRAWSVEAEARAVETLRGLVTDSAYRSYVLTGAFIETSRRSRVTYLFRKLRPTVAIRGAADGGMRILATLCLHPIGFYEGTWGGVMVPTDDVIAHLMMMRGCEAKFWGKANHHPSWAPSAGI